MEKFKVSFFQRDYSMKLKLKYIDTTPFILNFLK